MHCLSELLGCGCAKWFLMECGLFDEGLALTLNWSVVQQCIDDVIINHPQLGFFVD